MRRAIVLAVLVVATPASADVGGALFAVLDADSRTGGSLAAGGELELGVRACNNVATSGRVAFGVLASAQLVVRFARVR